MVVAVLEPTRKAALQPAQGVKHRHLAGIVDILDVDAAELPEGARVTPGAVAVVAEHIPGRTLRSLLEVGKLHPAKAVAWTLRLGEALQALHGAGAIHGAISPRSVIAEPAGRAIAPVLSQLVAPPLAAYCPPERLKGGAASPSDDVWALYATLFAALTGAPPFVATTREALIKAVLSKPKPLAAFGIDEPVLQEIVQRGLLPDRSVRNADLVELMESLDAWERDPEKPLAKRPNAPRPGLRGLGDIVGGALGAARDDGLVVDDHDLPDDQGTDLPEASSPQAVVVPLARPEPSSTSMAAAAGVEPPAAKAPEPAAVAGALQASQENSRITPGGIAQKRVSLNPFERKRTLWPWLVAAALVGGAGVYLVVEPDTTPVVKAPTPPPPPPKPRPKPPAAPKKSPAEQRDACVVAHFPAESLPATTSFEFVCNDQSFLTMTRRLHDMVKLKPAATDAGVTVDAGESEDASMPALILRGAGKPVELVGLGLDWYELPATAIIRRTCCPGAGPIVMPETPGWCEQLQGIVGRMADDSQRAVDLAPGARAFDKAVTCLFANRIEHPFAYKTLPTPANRHAFQQFLSRAAIIGTRN